MNHQNVYPALGGFRFAERPRHPVLGAPTRQDAMIKNQTSWNQRLQA